MKRSKTILTALVILTLLLGSVAPASAMQYYSIDKLRKESAQGWHQTYESHGRVINVDIDIMIPDVDKIPVQKVKRISFSEMELPPEGAAPYSTKTVSSSCTILAQDFDYPSNVDAKPIESYYYPFLEDQAFVPNNSLTFREAVGILKDRLIQVQVDPERFTFHRPYELSAYNYYNKKTNEIALPGSYQLRLHQMLNNIPIILNIGQAYKEKTTRCFYPDMSCGLRSDESWQIIFDTVIAVETLAEDVPFCGLSNIIDAIETEINAGHIRKIFDIELGYIVYDDPTEKKPRGQQFEDFYVVPGWVVRCIYMENPKRDHQYAVDVNERNTLEYATIVINAQTGEMVNVQYNKKDKADYKGFISWEDVGEK